MTSVGQNLGLVNPFPIFFNPEHSVESVRSRRETPRRVSAHESTHGRPVRRARYVRGTSAPIVRLGQLNAPFHPHLALLAAKMWSAERAAGRMAGAGGGARGGESGAGALWRAEEGWGRRLLYRKEKARSPIREDGASGLCRRSPNLPHTFACSTIGPVRLNFRVRDGNGCDPHGKLTGKVVKFRSWRSLMTE